MEVWVLECGDQTAAGVLGVYSAKAQAITAAECVCPPSPTHRWDWHILGTQGYLYTHEDTLLLMVEQMVVDTPPAEGWRLFYTDLSTKET